jgi:aldehyde:ferredoxin oxidoreductase
MTPQELKRAGERITNLKKLFNIGQGWTKSDDWLPPRIFRDPLPTGVAQGSVLTEEELNTMIDGYFEARGWTRDGLIPKEKLRELGMDDIAEAWRRY